MTDASQTNLSVEELEAKRKARMERFGATEIEESQKSALANRRKQKMFRKKGKLDGADKGNNRTINVSGNKKRSFS